MRYFIFIVSLLISFKCLAQFKYIDQSELYKKFSIQEVNAYDKDDSGLTINDERWLIDKKGRIYSHKLLETQDDSTFSHDIYFFENDFLVKSYHIGIWNIKTYKVDTGTTMYLFNNHGQVQKSVYSNTRNTDTIISTYNYIENLLISRTYYDAYSRVKAVDSTFYYANKTPHIEEHTFFFPEFGSDIRVPRSKKLTYYDTTGVISLVLEFSVKRNGQLIPVRSKSFAFQNGKLTEIISLYLGTYRLWGSNLRRTVERYFYDNNGFIIKKEWFSGFNPEPYLVNTYDYK